MSDHLQSSLRPPVSPAPAAGFHRSSSPAAHTSTSIAGFGQAQAAAVAAAMRSPMAAASRYSLGSKLSSSSSSGTLDSANTNTNIARLSQQIAAAQAAAEQQARSPLMGGNLQMPPPNSATLGRGLRPSSEMLNTHPQATPESDAIDKWFEDLQHYEATLEEMAAASLDQNFKEELSAIEQWFRVLSEAERTAALYSLLQEATQVQIRFFITVLQQMARTDPMTALLSPAVHGLPNNQLLDHMDQKYAALGLKSPSAAINKSALPHGAAAYRQSTDASGFLSPNAAALYGNNNDATGGANSSGSAALAAQRAKLKANRISAPGTLPGERTYAGSSLDKVSEQRGDGSRSPQPGGGRYDQQQLPAGSRPKSTGGLSNISDHHGGAPRSPHLGMGGGLLDDQLSPLAPQGATWASMMNTPLVPSFDDKNAATGNALDAAAAQLASLSSDAAAGRSSVLLDPDVAKYKRKSSQSTSGGGQLGQGQNGGTGNVQGVLSGMFDGASPNLGNQWNAAQQQDLFRQAMALSPSAGALGTPGFSLSALAPGSPNTLAGLQSPSGGMGNPLNMQMMNAMAQMGHLAAGGNGSVNVNAAQFLAMQQQILQNQQNLAAMAEMQAAFARGGTGGGGGSGQRLATPNTAQFSGSLGGRRSPRPGGSSPSARNNAATLSAALGGGGGAAGGGGGEEEVADISMLEDVPAWLRHLRLHKYTPNFESSNWRDMVVMDDAALEAKGVAALGARRKMLKTFEAVRQKYGIKSPDGASGSAAATSDDKGTGASAAAKTDGAAEDAKKEESGTPATADAKKDGE
ncbi:Flap-structured DNA-binding and RNA-binding protein [Tilletia horrida]|nr:Flap-structured DNA-binding and RNA-binding protein [Tilletia horrida]